jgi:hypothetical protein
MTIVPEPMRSSTMNRQFQDNRQAIARDLHELIEALDRRTFRLDRSEEAQIAREAAALRARAQARLAELERKH